MLIVQQVAQQGVYTCKRLKAQECGKKTREVDVGDPM